MNYIITAGYCGTGSSIPNDLLRECEGYKTFDCEFKLLTGIDGLIDLEKALVDGPQYIKVVAAVSRFEEFCRNLNNKKNRIYNYNKSFSPRFSEQTEKFIDKIIDRYYTCGSSQYSVSDMKKVIFSFGARGYRLQFFRKYIDRMDVPFITITPEQFYDESRRLLAGIFDMYEEEGYHSCVLDQGLMPVYSSRLPLYFPNGKMIIVDWDPRDVAVGCIRDGDAYGMELRKHLDAEFFCKWYKMIRREYGTIDNRNIMHIRYEELALNYDEARKKLFEFLGIDLQQHKDQYKYFDPSKSAKKIGRWREYYADEYFTHDEWIGFCNTVRGRLADYCYD